MGALLGLVLMFQAFSSAQDETEQVRAELQGVQTQMEALRLENAERSSLQGAINQVEELSARRGGVSRDWRLVLGLLGDGLELESIGITNTGLLLQVSADSLERGEQFVEELRQIDRFSSVSLPREVASSTGRGSVALSIQADFAAAQ